MTSKQPVSWFAAMFSCSKDARSAIRAASAMRSALTREGTHGGASNRAWAHEWPKDHTNPLNDWMGGVAHYGGSTVSLTRNETAETRLWGIRATERISQRAVEIDPGSLFMVMVWSPDRGNGNNKPLPSCQLVVAGQVFGHSSGFQNDYTSSPVNTKVYQAWRSPEMVLHLARARLATAQDRVPALLQWRADMLASHWPQPAQDPTPTLAPPKPRF